MHNSNTVPTHKHTHERPSVLSHSALLEVCNACLFVFNNVMACKSQIVFFSSVLLFTLYIFCSFSQFICSCGPFGRDCWMLFFFIAYYLRFLYPYLSWNCVATGCCYWLLLPLPLPIQFFTSFTCFF